MSDDKKASSVRVSTLRSAPTCFLLVIGMVSVVASAAWTERASAAQPTNTVIASIAVGQIPEEVVVSPDNNSVYVTNFLSNTVSVINAKTDVVEKTISVGKSPYGLAISSDGSTLYVSQDTSPGAVTVIQIQ